MERLNNYPLHESIRGYAGYELYKLMAENPDIYLITADLGFGMLTPHQEDFKKQFINVGASEVTMMGLAVGLAQEGKRPFTYTISSFYMRAAEPIALYVAREQLPIIMLGSGRDDDYKHDGPSHNATTTQEFMKMIGIESLYPETKEEIPDILHQTISNNKPTFISLKR